MDICDCGTFYHYYRHTAKSLLSQCNSVILWETVCKENSINTILVLMRAKGKLMQKHNMADTDCSGGEGIRSRRRVGLQESSSVVELVLNLHKGSIASTKEERNWRGALV